jgi:hypothetical protein
VSPNSFDVRGKVALGDLMLGVEAAFAPIDDATQTLEIAMFDAVVAPRNRRRARDGIELPSWIPSSVVQGA